MQNPYFDFIHNHFGFGCMRLPMVGDKVDIPQTTKMVDAFLARGFNYFDTAHGYIGGKSELAVKECLTSRYPRDSYILTDKLSPNFFNTEAEIRPYFESMLEACGVEYFDFFLLHSLTAGNYPHYTGNRAFEIAAELKAEGKVRHVGISFHDKADVLDMILSEQPAIEVVQLQFNYADYNDDEVQAKKCLEVCRKFGKDVIVMEPVRGGSLVALPEEAKELLESTGKSCAEYAVRYAASHEGIFMVLSGMSNMEQLVDNIRTFEERKPLNEAETKAVFEVAEGLKNTVPCTACRYCVDGCPMGLDIPFLLSVYNDLRYAPVINTTLRIEALPESKKPDVCVGCGKCSKIRKLLIASINTAKGNQ